MLPFNLQIRVVSDGLSQAQALGRAHGRRARSAIAEERARLL
jgi:hypothetical protein